MADFHAKEFVGNPSVEEFKKDEITKNDLTYVAKSFGIPHNQDAKKDWLHWMILTYLGDTKDTEDFEVYSGAYNVREPQYLLEIEKKKLKSKHNKWKLISRVRFKKETVMKEKVIQNMKLKLIRRTKESMRIKKELEEREREREEKKEKPWDWS